MMNLESLVASGVRKFMLDELQHDFDQGNLYESHRLSTVGRTQYPTILREALKNGTPQTLAAALSALGILSSMEIRQRKNGPIEAKVPVTAPETLAEGEFNRFYARGVCRQATADGQVNVQVYRAKGVTSPRSESTAKIGALVSAAQLLADLRANPGVETALGIPSGPNSGLSVRLIAT
jgi:hypothetical protein